MERADDALVPLLASELGGPAPAAARHLSDEIRRRHGPALASVVFYGSCLRRGIHEGVLDFYALVDDYPSAYRSRWLAWANALLAPNVFYLEVESPLGTLRAKYAVVSTADFEAAAGGSWLRPGIWARFCQPALAVYARDDEARASLLRLARLAVGSALERILPLLPASDGEIHFSSPEFWALTLRETYAAEMRPERSDTIGGIYAAQPERFDRVARAGLDELEREGWLQLRSEGGELRVVLPEDRRRSARRAWRLRRPLAKLAYVSQLFKTATTFGDWLPYVLWKVERHSGVRLVPTVRQRRHPLIWGWPLLFEVLRRRALR